MGLDLGASMCTCFFWTPALRCALGGSAPALSHAPSGKEPRYAHGLCPTGNVGDSLSDAEVAAYWKWTLDEVVPALQKVPGVRSVKIDSGAGGLRADMRYVFEMDDAGVYERVLADPQLRALVAKTYAAWDMTTASQLFLREVTPALLQALSGST
jgi:hypothetical protein